MSKSEIEIGNDCVLYFDYDGFSVLDNNKGKYIIDASTFRENQKIRVGDKTFRVDFVEAQKAIEIRENSK